MAASLESYLNLIRSQLDRGGDNAGLRQRLAEMHAACGDFDTARRLHGEAVKHDPGLARRLAVPQFTQAATPAVLCAISNICNINCRICETQDASVAKGNMDYGLICAIVDQCKARGIGSMVLHHVNEPLLHPNIFDILLYLEDRDMGALISTNANEMRSVLERARRQARLPKQLNLRYSIDAGRRETYNEIRRGGDFDQVVKGVTALRDFCVERGIALKTASNYVMTAKSIHELADFADTFAGLIPFDQMYFSIVNGNTPNGLNQYIIDNRVTDFVRRTPCDVPFSLFNILRDGRVSLCCVDFNEEAIVGDIRRDSIDDIWNGPELTKHRAALASQDVANLHPICQRCYVAEAAAADGPVNVAIQQMLALKSDGVAVSNEHIFSRIRFELMLHGLDVVDPKRPLRLFETTNDFVAVRG